MTFYIKYRPQVIEDLDLTDVRETLKAVVLSGNIPHAFLFAGPRGAGKTSAARILAKAINCEKNKKTVKEPCNKCTHCTSITKGSSMDVIEIDAASHRGIDDIRALRENIALAPSSARKKVYIIDEAHMLTAEAANAFLKTLEEPPDHVIFILATTNPEKLPETVRSRLTLVNFTKANPDEIRRQLGRVISGENIKLEDGVIDLIIKASDGSFRDAVKLLEHLSLEGKEIKKLQAEKLLFQTDKLNLNELFVALGKRDATSAIELIEQAVKNGGSARNYADRLIEHLHQALLAEEGVASTQKIPGIGRSAIIQLLEYLISAKATIPYSGISHLPIEMAVSKWCHETPDEVRQEEKKERPPEKKVHSPAPANGHANGVTNGKVSGQEIPTELWQQILLVVRNKNSSVEALLRSAKPLSFDGKELTLAVYYQFHKEQLETTRNRNVVETAVMEVLELSSVHLACNICEREVKIKNKQSQSDMPLTDTRDTDIIQAAKEIFDTNV